METVDWLQQIGFSEYEARAYLALLAENPLTGYALAKLSEVPRANIYAVLQKLEKRGAVHRVAEPEGTRYVPVPPDELMQGLESAFHATVQATREALAHVPAPPQPAAVWNATGSDLLVAQARALVVRAESSLLIGCTPPGARALAGSVAQAASRGVTVTTLCLAGCPQECAYCRGEIVRTALAPDAPWLVVVADDAQVLTGELPAVGEGVAVGTRQPLLVALAGWAIRHSHQLATDIRR